MMKEKKNKFKEYISKTKEGFWEKVIDSLHKKQN